MRSFLEMFWFWPLGLAHWLRHQPSPYTALGSQGIRVGPADWPAPQVVARKRADCGV